MQDVVVDLGVGARLLLGGVGMDVVRRRIVALGGRCAVASTPGRGTRFTITLPLTAAESPECPEQGSAQVGFVAAKIQSARILVAEDDPVSQLLARDLLARQGALVTLAATGTEATPTSTHTAVATARRRQPLGQNPEVTSRPATVCWTLTDLRTGAVPPSKRLRFARHPRR